MNNCGTFFNKEFKQYKNCCERCKMTYLNKVGLIDMLVEVFYISLVVQIWFC